jgi:hypothetical protein
MAIHVVRNSEELGAHSPEEILDGLRSGRFVASDLAWRFGMTAWTPLGEWKEFSGSGVPSALASSESPSDDGHEARIPAMPSWEQGASIGNFLATIKEVALEPARTFANLRSGGFARPISFAYWGLLPSWLCGGLLYGLIFSVMAIYVKDSVDKENPFVAWVHVVGPLGATLVVFAMLGVIFVFVPLFYLLSAMLMHLLLLPWRPSGSFAQTFRATSYSCGVLMPFAIIPCLNYVLLPWLMVAIVIAHSQAHRIAWWKVLISFSVLPLFCLFGYNAAIFLAICARYSGLLYLQVHHDNFGF